MRSGSAALLAGQAWELEGVGGWIREMRDVLDWPPAMVDTGLSVDEPAAAGRFLRVRLFPGTSFTRPTAAGWVSSAATHCFELTCVNGCCRPSRCRWRTETEIPDGTEDISTGRMRFSARQDVGGDRVDDFRPQREFVRDRPVWRARPGVQREDRPIRPVRAAGPCERAAAQSPPNAEPR